MKLENKSLKYINNLYDAGKRKANDLSTFEQEDLTRLLIEATLPRNLPKLDSIFNHVEFLDRAAQALTSHDPLDGYMDFMNFVAEELVKHYLPEIDKLMEQTNDRSKPPTEYELA